MKLLVVGGGGREHAIIKSLKKNPEVTEIFALPGNGGIAADAVCVPIGATEIDKIVSFAKEQGVDYAVVAPDDPLVLGCVDALEAAKIPCFGPRARAAIIEGSKVFSKNLMKKYGIPTARYEVFSDMAAALAYLQDNGLTDYEQLEQKATAATERFHKLSDQIKSTEAALHTNMELRAATVQYAKTRPVFEKYKASKYSKKFLAEHEADIELYRAACADFKAILGGAKLPKMDTLKEEGRKLSEQKKKLYAEYRKTKVDMQEVTTIKANIDYLLGYSEPSRKKEQER